MIGLPYRAQALNQDPVLPASQVVGNAQSTVYHQYEGISIGW